jgi:hypothetical protein
MYLDNINSEEYQNILEELKIYYSDIIDNYFEYNISYVVCVKRNYRENEEYTVSIKLEKYTLSGWQYLIECYNISVYKLKNISRINKLNKLKKLNEIT